VVVVAVGVVVGVAVAVGVAVVGRLTNTQRMIQYNQ
jgi:hypothetical protein